MRTATDGRGRSVLVVDDMVDAAESTAELIAHYGYSVQVAHTGAGAIRLATADPPEVILMDLSTPDMDGCETARRILAELPGRRPYLVATTCSGTLADRRRTAEAGFDLHLLKPVEPDHVIRVLNGVAR
jgi:two-component system CheB/CheR fusion protein